MSDQSEALFCIKLIVDFWHTESAVEEVLLSFSEDQFDFLWRVLYETEELSPQMLSPDQQWTFRSWITSTEKHHYNRLQQFMNALLLNSQTIALRSPTLFTLKQVILARMIRKELKPTEAYFCLLMIAQHEESLMLKCRDTHYKENDFEPVTVSSSSEPSAVALIDIDFTLMKTLKNGNVYNFNLIEALTQGGIRSIYLFSDMACNRDTLFFREKLIHVLQERGILVLGVMTPLDLVADLDMSTLVDLYEKMIEQDRMELLNHRVGKIIFNRLVKGLYPSDLGRVYRERLALLQTLDPEDYAEFDRAADCSVELIRSLARLISNTEAYCRNIHHVKGFLFEQFLKHNQHYEKVYVIDDLEVVLRSVENVFSQTSSRISLSTIPVKAGVPFEIIPVEKYARRIACEYYRKYSGRGERFLSKFSQLAVKPTQQPVSSVYISAEETYDTIQSLMKQYIETGTQKNEFEVGLKKMLQIAVRYHQKSLSAPLAYLIKKFPEFKEALASQDDEEGYERASSNTY